MRAWEPYHTPKNLTMLLASEVGELRDVLRRLTPDESVAASSDPKRAEAIADELADIANIVFLLSVHTGIDLSEAVASKMARRMKSSIRRRRSGGDGRTRDASRVGSPRCPLRAGFV